MRTLILGAGGIGGFYGGRLAQAGADVTFLVRPARAERLKADNLVIESPLGDATLPVRALTEADGPYDLVLLSCKSYDLDAAIAALRPAVGPGTILLPLLNGIAHLDTLDAAFGPEHVIGGTAHISVTMTGDGTIRQLSKLQTVTFGARGDALTARCASIEALLAKGGFDVRRSPAIMRDMWEKFAFITAASAITCLMRASVGAIVAAQDGERLTRGMLEECQAVAEASGFPVRPKAKDFGLAMLTEKGSAFTASMLRDLESGGKIETDHLQGDMIRRGTALGLDTTLLRVAFCHLQAYQNRRST